MTGSRLTTAACDTFFVPRTTYKLRKVLCLMPNYIMLVISGSVCTIVKKKNNVILLWLHLLCHCRNLELDFSNSRLSTYIAVVLQASSWCEGSGSTKTVTMLECCCQLTWPVCPYSATWTNQISVLCSLIPWPIWRTGQEKKATLFIDFTFQSSTLVHHILSMFTQQ